MTAERRHTIAVVGLGVSAAVIATVVFALFVQPFDDDHYGDAGLTISNLIVGLMVAGIAVLIAMGIAGQGGIPTSWRAALLAAALTPLAVSVWAWTLRDDHRIQRDAVHGFERYTLRFPPGALGSTFIQNRVRRYVTVCAPQVQRPKLTEFCTEGIVAKHGDSFDVVGGYRWHPDDEPEENTTDHPSAVFDCFGDATACIGQ